MTNVMHKLLVLIYLSIYFCLTGCGLKESPKHVRQKEIDK
jgi:predicted small lipoprotein YifL